MEDVRYRLELEGVSTLVFNSNEALIDGEDKGRDPKAYEREHFRDKCYVVGGRLVIPARNIKKMLVEACKFYPKKPKGVSFKSFGPFVQAATLVPQDAVLASSLEDVKPLTVVVNLDPSKGTKGPRGPRTRPAIHPPWMASAELMVFDPILTKDALIDIAEIAGKMVGVCDGRAIDFGRCLISVKRTS